MPISKFQDANRRRLPGRKADTAAGAILIIVYLTFAAQFCTLSRYATAPGEEYGSPSAYRSLNLTANITELSSGRKQSIKILLKFVETKARMLLLGPPLNRVYAVLETDGEAALLIDSKKKKYWRGDFKTLLLEIWDIDFTYMEFKNLLTTGTLPREKIEQSGLDVSVEMEPKHNRPGRIIISNENIMLKLKISGWKIRKGPLPLSMSLEKMQESDSLADLLENE
ncbi:MAG: hypothetical protein L0Y73_02250 [Candidatus Aminicenantes bacterium]|nr:hypothetical protein [Candidatus Aminicenantes bacterium]